MRYSEHIDYLLASIVYLGTQPSFWARRPNYLAAELSLDEARMRRVLNGFPGIFRKSPKAAEHGEHYYSLQARYALRTDYNTVEKKVRIPPLPVETVRLMYEFVQKSADDERSGWRSILANGVAVAAAITSALTAVYVATTKEPKSEVVQMAPAKTPSTRTVPPSPTATVD